MTRIAVIAEYASVNGGENSLLALLPGLQKQGFEFTVIAPSPSGDEHVTLIDLLQQLDIPHVAFPFIENGKRQPLDQLRLALREKLSICRPDILHANSLSMSRVIGPVCADLRIPSVGYLRDIIKLNKTVIRDLNCCNRLVAVSHATRDFHIAQGMDESRSQVIHNGIDPHIFEVNDGCSQHDDLRSELSLPSDSKLVLYVGQLGLRKGLDVWLQIAEQVASESPNTHFLMVGERHSEKAESIELEKQLKRIGEQGSLKGRVHWLGRRSDVPRLMKQVDVLLHAAKQEPLGRVLLEAFAAGLPAVASDVGGTKEIFHLPALASQMFSIDDPQSAAQSVLRLIDDEGFHKQTSELQSEVAAARFSVDRAVAELAAVYGKLAIVNS